jgi:nucleoside-diphosphate-sugar epimerase
MTLRVAMTGASGAVGTALHQELVRRGHTVTPIGRREALHWDLRDPLPDDARRCVAEADVVVHAAADIRLDAGRDELSRVNVEAVEQLAEASRGARRPPRLVHISSAFAEPPADRPHNNNYEWSKWQAEEVVRASGLPATIVRPSLVIGRRGDGVIGRFSGIYIFLRMLRLGLVPAIPGFGDVRIDVVPVDVVAELGARAVERSGTEAAVVPATSGTAAPTLKELVDVVFAVTADELGEQPDRPKFVKPDVYHRLFRPIIEERLSPAQLVLLDTVEIFLPYFERDHLFPSGVPLTRDEVRDAWTASTRHWLTTAGAAPARGRAVWAQRP